MKLKQIFCFHDRHLIDYGISDGFVSFHWEIRACSKCEKVWNNKETQQAKARDAYLKSKARQAKAKDAYLKSKKC